MTRVEQKLKLSDEKFKHRIGTTKLYRRRQTPPLPEILPRIRHHGVPRR